MPFGPKLSQKSPAGKGGSQHRQMVMATLDSLGEDLGALMLKHKSMLHDAGYEPEPHNVPHPSHTGMDKGPGPAHAGAKPPTEEFNSDADSANEDPESRFTEDVEVEGQESKEAEAAGINKMLTLLGSKAGPKGKKSQRY